MTPWQNAQCIQTVRSYVSIEESETILQFKKLRNTHSPRACCCFLLAAVSSTDLVICKWRKRSAPAHLADSDVEPKASPPAATDGVLWGVKSCTGDPNDSGVLGAVRGSCVPARSSKRAATPQNITNTVDNTVKQWLIVIKERKGVCKLFMEIHLTTTECHLPYGITQCYLPPDKRTHPASTPARQAGVVFAKFKLSKLRLLEK